MKPINNLPRKTFFKEQLGNLKNLTTDIKSDLVGAINWLHSFLLEKLGDTDISAIGDGTVTGAISQVNSDLEASTTVEEFVLQRYHGTQSWGYALKYGRIVYLYIGGRTSEIFNINTEYQLSNFPVDWMPMGNKFFSVPLSDYSNGIHLSAFFDTTNECFSINSPVSGLDAECLIRFSLTYISEK